MLRQNNCSFDNVYEVVDYLEDFEAELIEFVSTGGTLQLWVAFFSDTPMKGFCIPLALTKRLAAIGLDLHIFMYPRDALRLV